MKRRVLSPVLVRGPLGPVRVLARAGAALLAHPLGPAALEVASRDLGAALAGRKRTSASSAAILASIDRYGRRAAFRATPSGLLGGVALAPLGARTQLETGAASALLRPSWGRLWALGRGLLDEPAVRAGVNLRCCPSLLRGPDEVVWLGLEDDGLSVRSAVPDGLLLALIEASAAWTAWPVVRAALAEVAAAERHAGGESDGPAAELDDELDDWLLVLIDQGLLCHDLAPPLVGPPPLSWTQQRLAGLRRGLAGEAAVYLDGIEEQLALVLEATARRDVGGARAALAALPGTGDLHGTLTFAVQGAVSRRAVERAAELGPLLFRLQEALAAPVAERALDAGLLARLHDAAEQFGAGAFSLEALALGGYGARLVEGEFAAPDAAAAGTPADVLGYLIEALTEAARAGRPSITLEPAILEVVLPAARTPASFELHLAPTREAPRAAPGTGWLLGHHAPAGASFGRFAETLGQPLLALLSEIALAEGDARPGEQALDVVQAATPGLGDLSLHPPVRAGALALTGWPEGAPAITPAQLALVIDEAAAEPLALRLHQGQPVAPAALHRVRSTTVPPGLYRLLAGWSFARQHTPWSFTWPAALALQSFLPRVVLEGFVLAPASWALPADMSGRWLSRWRRQSPAVPRWVQVGQGDELLPVDLKAHGAAADLARHAGGRVFEIWPPLGRLADAGGRRLELIAAVVDSDDDSDAGSDIAATARAGEVPPPAQAPPALDWLTFRLYGAREHQDALLFAVVRALVAEARAAGELHGWFFLRYCAEGRDHLRLRLQAVGKPAALRRRIERALAPARQDGLVTAVEQADYFRETARYGGAAAMLAAERLFEQSSELVLQVLADEDAGVFAPEDDRLCLLVRAQDALGRGLGLALEERRALAERRRAAFAHVLGAEPEELKQQFRQRQRLLAARLPDDGDADSHTFGDHARAVSALLAPLPAPVRAAVGQALPALLHMQAVRLCGLDPEDERAGYVFWARALAGQAARGKR